MDNVKILEVPHSLPLGWDIADQPPPDFSFEKILRGPPPEKTLADLCLSTEQLAVMESRMSQILRPLRDNGLVSDRGLTLTDLGKLHLAGLWPDQYGHYKQIKLPF